MPLIAPSENVRADNAGRHAGVGGRAGVHHTDDAAGTAAEVVDVSSREQRNDAAVTVAKEKTAAMAETVLGTSVGRNQDAGTFPVMIDLIWNKASICCRQV
jgi:hypothetical protein